MSTELADLEAEVESLRSVVASWGSVLLSEGRLTQNDVRGALYHQAGPALIRPHPLFEERATAQGISTGDYVAWNTSGGKAKGRVVSIHTDSTVPNAPTKVQGTADDPAARINVHEPHPDGSRSGSSGFRAWRAGRAAGRSW